MLTTLWFIFWSLLRLFFECVTFLPRYVFIERHDTRSAVWGARAEAIVSLSFSAWGHDVVRRMDCLRCLKRNGTDRGGALRQVPQRLCGLRAPPGPPAPLRAGGSPQATEALRHLSRWIQDTTTELLQAPQGSTSEDDSFSQANEVLSPQNDVQSSSSNANPSFSDEEEDTGNELEPCSASAIISPHVLQGIFTTGVTLSISPRAVRAIPVSRTSPSPPVKGFVPPLYAVHAKAQLLLALVDPLARIASELLVCSGITAGTTSIEGHREECRARTRRPQASRLSSVRWLTAPPPTTCFSSSGSVSAAVILLLCPSAAQGGDSGRVARRVAALCAALSAVAAARRESAEQQRRPIASRDARFATWHVAVPIAEVRSDKEDGTATETAPVSVEDVERIVRHLRARFQAVAVETEEYSPPTSFCRTRPPTTDDVIPGARKNKTNAKLDSHKRKSTPLKCEEEEMEEGVHTLARSVYIIGVGCSQACGPLLQYVMAQGRHTGMDGLVSISYTLSSNYKFLHETPTDDMTAATGTTVSSKPMMGTECGARDSTELRRSVAALTLPFQRALLHEGSGTMRLLFVAARLEMIAENLRRANEAGRNVKLSSLALGAEAAAKDPTERTEDPNSDETETASAPHVLQSLCRRMYAAVFSRLKASRSSSMPASPSYDFLNALAHADAQADRDLSRLWLDASTSPCSSTTSATAGRSMTASVSVHRRGSAVPVTKLMALSFPPLAAQRGASGLFSADWDALLSPSSRDDASWGRVDGDSFAVASAGLFEMARGRSASRVGTNSSEDSPRCAMTPRDDSASRISKVELRYRSKESVVVIARIRVPTLFLHALDDATAPLSTLPMEALATNPKVFTVLTRRGGHGVYLESVGDFFGMPRLTQRVRPRRTQNGKCKAEAALPLCPPIETTAHSFEDDESEMETQLVIEGTTWVERLLVEFISSAVLSSHPKAR